MASNLNEYYKSQGKALPSVTERQGVASQAGISNYTGTAEQNASLLGYLTKLPSQSGNNVITSENLTPEKLVTTKPTVPDTNANGMIATVGSLAESNKKALEADQKQYNVESTAYAKALKDFGDQGAFQEKVIKDQGVDVAKNNRNRFLSQIEAEQNSVISRIEEIRKNPRGMTEAGVQQEIDRVQQQSATKLARYGIGLSAASRDYESAANIANRLIESNSDKLKADIESRKFVLDQLGTKLATEKSNALSLELKRIDREDSLIKTAITEATKSANDGFANGEAVSNAVQKLISGEISLSEFDTAIGNFDSQNGILGGKYDITTYATDPKHEQRVQSIYDTIGTISDSNDANEAIKSLSSNSPITGTMVMNASQSYNVDPAAIIAIMQQDSSLGTAGLGVKTKNPGNVGNDDSGRTVTFNSWQEGVNAVGKWLSNHKATNVYRGEFKDTINTVTQATSESQESKRKNAEIIKKAVAEKKYGVAYKQVENTVSKILTGENKTQYDAKRVALPSILDLKEKLLAYKDSGGQTGLLKGTYEKIYNKLGEVKDEKYKALATDLRISLQRYRKDLSGAAFSAQEAKDYESVNPAGTNSLDLNLSIIEGMSDNFKRTIDSTVNTYAGDEVQQLRQISEGTVPPARSLSSVNKFETNSNNPLPFIGVNLGNNDFFGRLSNLGF